MGKGGRRERILPRFSAKALFMLEGKTADTSFKSNPFYSAFFPLVFVPSLYCSKSHIQSI